MNTYVTISIDNGEMDDVCPICLGEYEKGEIGVKLMCTHKFHEGCATTWLTKVIRYVISILPESWK